MFTLQSITREQVPTFRFVASILRDKDRQNPVHIFRDEDPKSAFVIFNRRQVDNTSKPRSKRVEENINISSQITPIAQA
jgi:hypothetical protein